jgi:His/Glu/Gln/Arg/opine family amino acid ABC transporter permease subunit
MTYLASLIESVPELWKGLLVTLRLIVVSAPAGLALGVVAGLTQVYGDRFSRGLATAYQLTLRGVPLIVQLFILYYGLPRVGITMTPFAAATLGFTLCSGAYHSEYVRGAVLSISDGQMEAGRAVARIPRYVGRPDRAGPADRLRVVPLPGDVLRRRSDLPCARDARGVASSAHRTIAVRPDVGGSTPNLWTTARPSRQRLAEDLAGERLKPRHLGTIPGEVSRARRVQIDRPDDSGTEPLHPPESNSLCRSNPFQAATVAKATRFPANTGLVPAPRLSVRSMRSFMIPGGFSQYTGEQSTSTSADRQVPSSSPRSSSSMTHRPRSQHAPHPLQCRMS